MIYRACIIRITAGPPTVSSLTINDSSPEERRKRRTPSSFTWRPTLDDYSTLVQTNLQPHPLHQSDVIGSGRARLPPLSSQEVPIVAKHHVPLAQHIVNRFRKLH